MNTLPTTQDAEPTTPATPGRRFATARTAGTLYVIIIACGLFAEIGVRSRLIEAGDPAAMAKAFAIAIEAGQLAFAADPMGPRDMAAPSTPLFGKAFLE